MPQRTGTIDRSEDLQLVSVGNLRILKNHETVLRALAQAKSKDVRLTVISDGPDGAALEQYCSELGIADRVLWTGRISREQTLKHLWRANAFVSMSRGEGLPVAVLEAMSCHCPVVLSDIPPHREIRGTRNDLIPLFEPGDHRELAKAIDDWAGMPLDVLRGWGADCRQHVERDCSLDLMLANFDSLLEEFDADPTLEWSTFCRSVSGKRRERRAA